METATWNSIVNKQLEMGQDTGLFAKQRGKVSCGTVIGADTQAPFVWIGKFQHHTRLIW